MSCTSSIIEEFEKIEMNDRENLLKDRPPPFSTLRSDGFDISEEDNLTLCEENSPVIISRNSISSSKSDSMVSLKHYDALLGELRCPGCARPMNSPIFLCKAGHSVCELCTKTLTDCPLCHEELTEIRSVTLEALAAKAYFSCKNASHGCTVRLPNNLMAWHKERCVYQVGDCFMGKVYDGCSWNGCEIDWMKHCFDFHSDKIFNSPEATLTWNYPLNVKKLKPVLGFYIFQAFDETFNLYHVYDRPSSVSKWTMVCASKKDNKMHENFAFQIELFSPWDPSRLLAQRHSCHGERDEDVLEEARCVSIGMGDAMRFMSADKVLNYRVKLMDIRELRQDLSLALVKNGNGNSVNGQKKLCDQVLSEVEHTNHKKVPTENIIRRRPDLVNMIATIDEEEFDLGRRSSSTCSINGSITVHDHSNGKSSSVYSVYDNHSKEHRKSISNATTINHASIVDIYQNEKQKNAENKDEKRKSLSRKSSLIKDFQSYDSMKKIFNKTMSLDRGQNGSMKIQKPPRKFLSTNLKKSQDNEFDLKDLDKKKSRDDADLECCSLPDHIPSTPPPKKTPKKSNSIINLVRSNLKF